MNTNTEIPDEQYENPLEGDWISFTDVLKIIALCVIGKFIRKTS